MAFDMRSNMSPSLAKKVVDEDMSDDEFDFDEEYFMRTYKPLSNLPTPPPSSQNSSAALSPMLLEMQDGEMRDPAFFGKQSPSGPIGLYDSYIAIGLYSFHYADYSCLEPIYRSCCSSSQPFAPGRVFGNAVGSYRPCHSHPI